jgi:hypothetical protein
MLDLQRRLCGQLQTCPRPAQSPAAHHHRQPALLRRPEIGQRQRPEPELPEPARRNASKRPMSPKATATNKNSLYDSYIKAFRWASDRLDPQGGIVAFVSNGAWLDGNAMDRFPQNHPRRVLRHLRLQPARQQPHQRRTAPGAKAAKSSALGSTHSDCHHPARQKPKEAGSAGSTGNTGKGGQP